MREKIIKFVLHLFGSKKRIFTLYCDESGNTGTDWLNNDQPFFIYGGWLVEEQVKPVISKSLNILMEQTQSAELKSSNVFKKGKGDDKFKLVYDCMMKNNALPFYIIAEKKFLVAAKIVETFFDPEYNRGLLSNFTYPLNVKKSMAQIIMENDDILKMFIELIKNGSTDITNMVSIQKKLIEIFSTHNLDDVVTNLNNIKEKNLHEMIEEFLINSNNGGRRTGLTLTIPILSCLLQNVEVFCDLNNISVYVVYDNLRGYDDTLAMFEKTYLKKSKPIKFIGENNFILSNFPHVLSMKAMNSKQEIFIQLSDLLCGFMNKIYKKIYMNQNLSTIENEFMKFSFVLYEDYRTWGTIVTDKIDINYFSKVFEREGKLVDHCEVIRNDFHLYMNHDS